MAAIPLIPATWLDTFASFKAGKDLAVGDDGPVSTMEPKLPA